VYRYERTPLLWLDSRTTTTPPSSSHYSMLHRWKSRNSSTSGSILSPNASALHDLLELREYAFCNGTRWLYEDNQAGGVSRMAYTARAREARLDRSPPGLDRTTDFFYSVLEYDATKFSIYKCLLYTKCGQCAILEYMSTAAVLVYVQGRCLTYVCIWYSDQKRIKKSTDTEFRSKRG
jgi:hypothetical protein